MEDRDKTEARAAVRDAARTAADEFGNTAEEVRHEAADQVRQTGERVRDRAEHTLESSKSRLVSRVGTLAEAIRQGSNVFRDQEQGDMARQSEQLADQIEEVRSFLDDYHVQDAFEDVRGMVRRRPALFIGGAAVALTAAAAMYLGGRGRRRD